MSDQLAQEERLRLLVQNAADVIAVVDGEGIVTYVSPSVTRMLGFEPAGLIGTSAFDFVHPDDLAGVRAAFDEALEKEGPGPPHEFRARQADGSYHEIETVLTNLLNEPSVAGIVVNARDVSERKRIEQELRASDERFRMLVEGSRDILSYRYRFLPEPKCEYMSPGAQTILGIAPEAFYAEPDLWRTLVHPDDLGSLEGARDLTAPAVVRWRRADGSYAWLEHRRALIFDDEGRAVSMEGIAHDVSQRKIAMEALETSERRF